MKFLLDENFPASAATLIESTGNEAVRFTDVCSFGDADETVFAVAQRENATILTSDRDFYHTIPFLHEHHAGIVVIALRQPSRSLIQERLSWFLRFIKPPLENRVFLLRDYSYRER